MKTAIVIIGLALIATLIVGSILKSDASKLESLGNYEYEFITVKDMPCVVVKRRLNDDFGISCDWSKYQD